MFYLMLKSGLSKRLVVDVENLVCVGLIPSEISLFKK